MSAILGTIFEAYQWLCTVGVTSLGLLVLWLSVTFPAETKRAFSACAAIVVLLLHRISMWDERKNNRL